jgi:hypothetical protein
MMVATLHANGDQFSYLFKVKRDRWVRSKCQEGLNAFELLFFWERINLLHTHTRTRQ